MQQKLTFIKSATLICGARVRYKFCLKRQDEEKARKLFKEMTTTLLSTCKACLNDNDFLAISDKISQRFRTIRDDEKKFIEMQLAPLEDDIPKSEIRGKEKQIIENVRSLPKKNSQVYTDIMRSISQECIKTLGETPCKFALVGLGSLAREEITLYSDFEHIILLDTGSDDSPSMEVREYFRWYSVIFQIIVIGVGETYIPTVGVKSLNDLYSGDEATNWYFDLYTPGGVSFDGRFPHSCKSPLGKQEISPNAGHVFELIQTVNGMLKYLTKQEGLKNDFHLRDILLRTCFVHGSEEIHEDFRKKTLPFMQRDSRNQEVMEQTKFYLENVNAVMNASVVGKPRTRKTMDFDRIKDFLYRPVSVMVGCLCRINRQFLGSNFDFFVSFRETHPSVDLHDLEYALAAACEVRLKLYSKVGHQRQKSWPGDLHQFIGKHCLARSVQTMTWTGMIFRAVSENSIEFRKFDKCLEQVCQQPRTVDGGVDPVILESLGFSEEVITMRKTLGSESASTYISAGLNDPKKLDVYFRKAEEIQNKTEEPAELTFEFAKTMSLIHFQRGNYADGFDLAEKWTKRYRENKIGPLNDFRYMQLQHLKAYCLIEQNDPEDIEKYASKEVKLSPDPMTQIFFKIALYEARLRLGNESGAKLALQSASLTCLSLATATQLHHDMHLEATKTIFKKQMRQGWTEDAALTFSTLGMLKPTVKRNTTEKTSVKVVGIAMDLSKLIKSGELERELVAVQRDYSLPGSISIERKDALVMLLLKRGIENFSDIATRFTETSPDALRDAAFYSALYCQLTMYSTRINARTCCQVGEDLTTLFSTFQEHVNHPVFLTMFRTLVIMIAKKSINLKRDIEKISAAKLRFSSQNKLVSLYSVAVQKFSHLHFKESAAILWKILHQGKVRITPDVKKSCCQLLAHMSSIAPFVALIHFLRNHRSTFTKFHSFPPTIHPTVEYNAALENLIKFRFQVSASSFWKNIFGSRPSSRIRQRSIEMLMFVILTKWDCGGYLMDVGHKYVSNSTKHVLQPAHATLYQDLYFALPLGAEDTRIALQNAFNCTV